MWILPKQLHTSAYVPDMAALISDSNEQSLACELSLLARSKPSPARTWSQRWKRDTWTRHLSGRMLKPSHTPAFTERWTSSLEAIPASPSAPQANGSAQMIPATSGPSSQMELLQCDQNGVSLKTSRDISRWGCPTSSRTWQEWVTELRGEYSRRLNAERRISGSGCSSWPTVCANEDSYRINGNSQQSRSLSGMARRGELSGPADPASRSTDGSRPASWATPRTGKTTDENPETWAKRQAEGKVATMPLTAQVKAWATPRSCSAMAATITTESANNPKRFLNLETQVGRAWGTPNARDWMGAPGQGCQERGGHRASLPGQIKKTENSGKLNPRWVETLMGLPVGWTMPSCASPVTIEPTNSDCSAMELSRPPQHEPSQLFFRDF
jgi:hypothetical protein